MSSTTSDKKCGRPRKSVWEYFTEIQDTGTGTTKKRPGAKCNFCNQQWSCGKSSDMIAHLALTCPTPPPPEIRSKFCEILRNGVDSDDDENSTEPSRKRQTKMDDHVEKSTISDDKQRRCTHALTKFFVCCGIPFWILENPFFVNFIKSLCSSFQLPGRTALSTSLINNECGAILSEIKKELASETNLTLG